MKIAQKKEGFALAVAIMAIVVIGSLIAGAFFASNQEFRVGRNTLIEQRAFSVAEYGLNMEISHWDRSRNLPSALATTFPVGRVDSTRIVVRQGDSAYVKVTRLSANTFWVVSTGVASVVNPGTQAVRRTNELVRLAYPTINVGGAVSVAGDLDLRGGSKVDGRNTSPPLWDCTGVQGMHDTTGIAVAPTANVQGVDTTGVSRSVYGSPNVTRTLTAADSNTYVRYGSETWNSLKQNADVSLPIGWTGGSGIQPQKLASDSTICDNYSTTLIRQQNWGEPNRGLGSITACQSYFPIIYSAGDLHINANGRGQGILLVEGDLTINGGFDFYGIIIVKDDVERGNGTASVHGTVMARNADIGDPSILAGTQDIYYSKCAVENALRGSAILVPTKTRGWAQLF
jgi:hypothetical protein